MKIRVRQDRLLPQDDTAQKRDQFDVEILLPQRCPTASVDLEDGAERELVEVDGRFIDCRQHFAIALAAFRAARRDHVAPSVEKAERLLASARGMLERPLLPAERFCRSDIST